MIRSVLLACLLLLSVSGLAYADRVDTAATASDADALVTYVAEYVAQKTPLVEAVQVYQAATSSIEKSDAAAAVRNAVDVTIRHMESLDTRLCFEGVSVMVLAEFGALARAFHVDTGPTLHALEIAQAGRIASGMSTAIVEAVFLCAPEAV